MSYQFLGQTQTRTQAPQAQIDAMNAPADKLPEMCRAGNKYACDLAKIPQLTDQQKAEMAARRDQQAAADREALAKRLENVGQTQVAHAVRTQQDVQYKSSGPSFTDIASGIASILNPLATAGSQVAAASFASRVPGAAPTAAPIYIQTQRKASNTPVIIAAAAGGALVLVLLVVMATR